MENITDLEKLADLKKKGVITQKEFDEQKKALLNSNLKQASCSSEAKSRLIYILLALFLGCLGIHNFYAGYNGKGIAQLLITLLLGIFIIPILAVWIWVIVEMVIVTKDAQGVPFC